MSGFAVQFYALPNEISTMLAKTFEDESIIVVKEFASPFIFQIWNRNDVIFQIWDRNNDFLSLENEKLNSLLFFLEQPRLDFQNTYYLLGSNPTALVLDIGRISSDGLSQSCLSTVTEDQESLKKWRSVASRFRRIMMNGVAIVNPLTQEAYETSATKFLRFTIGAQKAHNNGVKILPLAGTVEFRLPPLNK